MYPGNRFLHKFDVCPVVSKGGRGMMRRIHVCAVSVFAVLAFAVVPAFGVTTYSHHDGTAEDAIFSAEIGGAILAQFTATAERFLGVRVNVEDTSLFELLVADDGPTCPDATLYSTNVAADAPGWTEYFRIPRGTPISAGDVVYAGVRYLEPGFPQVGLDLGAVSSNTFAVDPLTHCEPVAGEALIDVVTGRMGDLNNDGDVDTGDALAAINIFLGVNPLDPMARLLGDANLDNTVDTADALAFINIFLGTKAEGELP